MASIVDLSWTNSEDLFDGVNLDTLYMIQHERVIGRNSGEYPYMILLHTGKITIAINLDGCYEQSDWSGCHGCEEGLEEDSFLFEEPCYGDA